MGQDCVIAWELREWLVLVPRQSGNIFQHGRTGVLKVSKMKL